MNRTFSMKKCIAAFLVAAMCIVKIPSLGFISGATNYAHCASEVDEDVALWLEEAGTALDAISGERDIMALVYMDSTIPLRVEADYASDVVANLYSGHQVNIESIYLNEDYDTWYYVRTDYNGQTIYGYVKRNNLAVADERFLNWENEYGMNFSIMLLSMETSYPDINQFPESYREGLLALKEKHPQWTFVRMDTNLDWNTAVKKESEGAKSLVYYTLPDWTKNGLYDSHNWYYATEAAVARYMDPRNALIESAIFQFEQLTYNATYHTLDAVQKFLEGTFMNKSVKPSPVDDLTYGELFYYLGRVPETNVSPFHLAARVLQEQGSGTSQMISGTYPGFEGYYNHFNVMASGRTNEEILINGLTYAKQHGWNMVYYSIDGGAKFISKDYIKKGQDTLYLQKYCVNPNGTFPLYSHQYMQNISAPTTEAKMIRNLYRGANSLDNTFVFKIPVYENMPAEPCGEPSVDASPSPDPSETPSQSPDPSETPSSSPEPSETPGPSPDPGETPGPSPDPGETPGPSPDPGETPGPSPDPGETPGPSPDPGEMPGPSPDPGETPGPSPNPGETPVPVEDRTITLQIPDGYTNTSVWIDGIEYPGTVTGNNISVVAKDQAAKTAVMYRYSATDVPEGMYAWTLDRAEGKYVATPQPELENILTYQGYSIRITGESGIRVKTAIPIALREQLLATGVGGYKLEEYGTVIMRETNKDLYPFIKDGEKVKKGVAYGYDGNGEFQDLIYETVNDVYKYTAVLINLPVSEYKSQYRFRGYITLNNGEKEITLYGPPTCRSIYELAERFLAKNTYQEGTREQNYLKKIISDADALGE